MGAKFQYRCVHRLLLILCEGFVTLSDGFLSCRVLGFVWEPLVKLRFENMCHFVNHDLCQLSRKLQKDNASVWDLIWRQSWGSFSSPSVGYVLDQNVEQQLLLWTWLSTLIRTNFLSRKRNRKVPMLIALQWYAIQRFDQTVGQSVSLWSFLSTSDEPTFWPIRRHGSIVKGHKWTVKNIEIQLYLI